MIEAIFENLFTPLSDDAAAERRGRPAYAAGDNVKSDRVLYLSNGRYKKSFAMGAVVEIVDVYWSIRHVQYIYSARVNDDPYAYYIHEDWLPGK